MKQLFFLTLLILFILPTNAKDKRFNVFKENSGKRAIVKGDRPLSVYYKNLAWNQKPNKIDSGYLYVKDQASGEILELKLIETEPNSGVFNLDFPNGNLPQKKYAAEVYTAPQSMLKGNNRVEIMRKLITDGSVKRKPFLLRVLRQKGQVVDVFDDKATALSSYNKYKDQMGLKSNDLESDSIIEVTNQEKVTKKKAIDTSTLQSLFLANESNLDANNAKNRELRGVLKGIETKRRQEVLTQSQQWSARKQKINARKAKEAVKKAVTALKNQDFKLSTDSFFAASDLIPISEDSYELYGVSLYRIKKYNPSIVILENSKPSKKRNAEKYYYLGMNYYQLKDYQEAINNFDKVIETNDKAFTIPSHFYKGIAKIEQSEFQKAIDEFQKVLDSSTDPKMDERAEKYIEYALDQKRLSEKRSNWLFFDGVLGLIYDSNIVLATDQARDQGTITNEAGWRFLGQLSTKARPYYSESDELNVVLDFVGIASRDEDFSQNTVVEQADPLILGISVPWTHRSTINGKGYFFEISPGFETISMDLDGTGSSRITDSIKLDFDNTLVVNKNWIAKADLFLNSNDSTLPNDLTDADSTAYGFSISSIIIVNKDLERYLIPEFGYQINDAKGATYSFNRADLGLTFTTATFWNLMWNSKLGYYLANYENGRSDNNWTLTTGLSARISSNWTWGISGTYVVNDSNQNRYKKHNIATTFGFSY